MCVPSADAIADEARGLVFPARIRITGSRLRGLDLRLRGESARANAETGGVTHMRGRTQANTNGTDVRPGAQRDALAALLSPGMAAQVEVITGRRSVLSYVLSPIAWATSEAGRER